MIGRLSHVAVAVPDLQAAARRYRDVLGADVGAPRDEPEHGVTAVFVTLPNTRVELLCPLGNDSPIAGFLERNPSGGIHHLCYEVEDIRAARQARAVPSSQGLQWHVDRAGASLMSVLSAIVLLAVVWFMVLFVVLPIRLETRAKASTARMRVSGVVIFHASQAEGRHALGGAGLSADCLRHSLGQDYCQGHRHLRSDGPVRSPGWPERQTVLSRTRFRAESRQRPHPARQRGMTSHC